MHVFNFQGSAIFGVLAFLGTGLVLLLAAGALVFLLATRRRKVALGVALGIAVVLAAYGVTLLAFSFSSHEQNVELGQEKYFCEVDCHLAYSVRNVERSKALGPPGKQVPAAGDFYVITLRTRFDPDTISSHRARDLPLTPNPRWIAIMGRGGKLFAPSLAGERALREGGAVESVPLTRPLRPGESYVTRLVFDLPPDVQDPRLVLIESDFVTRFLIGHENSFFHRKAVFRLEPGRA